MIRLLAAPGLTVKMLLRPEVKPLALAVSCLSAPRMSIRRSVKAAVPLPAPTPMSRVVVPWSGPVPELRVTVSGRLAGKPLLESLPKVSCDLTTGCVAKAAPAFAPAGETVNTSLVAAAAEMVKALLLTGDRLPPDARRVLAPARLMLRSLNVATPDASVMRAVVPLRAPVPLCNARVTDTPCTLFPRESCARTVIALVAKRFACWGSTVPARTRAIC